jgi:hypothetical protein
MFCRLTLLRILQKQRQYDNELQDLLPGLDVVLSTELPGIAR